MGTQNWLEKFRCWICTIWLHFFYRLLLYPLLGIVQRHFLPDIQFMNHGFDEDGNEEAEEENGGNIEKRSISKSARASFNEFLANEDEVNARALRAHCLLYEHTLARCPLYAKSLAGLDLLEVGCGLAGGLRWLRCAHPEFGRLCGVDPNPAAPESIPDSVTIFRGKAECLPFPSNSFDLILNVESSHCYGHKELDFFKEANRVLKIGGFLCWTDIRHREMIAKTLDFAESAGFKLVGPLESVNSQVLLGMRYTSARYERLLQQTPWWVQLFRHSLRTAYSPEGSAHEKLIRQEHLYMMGCWQKCVN